MIAQWLSAVRARSAVTRLVTQDADSQMMFAIVAKRRGTTRTNAQILFARSVAFMGITNRDALSALIA